MRIIGITGGIGAGKSVLSRVLRSRGFEVYDCDSKAKLLMDASLDLKNEIASSFGDECVDANGDLVRAEIARHLFENKWKRMWLNKRVHAMVRDDFRAALDNSNSDIFFIESAIMRTSGLDEMCDEIWIVEAPEQVRVDRVVARSGLSPVQINARIASQQSEFENLKCPVIKHLSNDGISSLLASIPLQPD